VWHPATTRMGQFGSGILAVAARSPVHEDVGSCHANFDVARTPGRRELRRLQALLGPSEDSYRKLQLDLLGARDAAIAAEAKVGNLRGQIVALTSLNARTEADAVSLLRQVYYRLFTERQRHLLQPMVSLARRTARLVRR
jgi:hypothetical protein